jgi:hypothetical protein
VTVTRGPRHRTARERMEQSQRIRERRYDDLRAMTPAQVEWIKNRLFAKWWFDKALASGAWPNAKTQECDKCGAPAEVWHHLNYADPANVVPLCAPCHGEESRGEGRFFWKK